jgi:hypothetical protein
MRWTPLLITLVLAACGEPEPPADAPPAIPRLDAVRLPEGESLVLDGKSADAIWRRARPVKVPLEGESGPAEVTLRAAYDAHAVFLLAQWPDEEPSLDRYWHYQGDVKWERTEKEDGFSLCWAPGSLDAAFREQSCALFCHDGRHTYPAAERGMADFWYWGAQRTNILKQAIDMWLPFGPRDRLRGDGQPEDSGIEPNISTEYRGPRYAPRRVSAERTPYLTWENTQVLTKEILQTRIRDSARVGWRIPCDILRTMKGSRGDIMAVGTHVSGGWILEIVRKLDTGHRDDKPVGDPLVPFFFSVAVHDNSGGADHAISGPVELHFLSKR